MSALKRNKNKSLSHKLKRAITFSGWRRNVSGKEKWVAKESRKRAYYEL